MAATTGQI